VRQGRLSKYASEVQAWLDLGNTPDAVITAAEFEAEQQANAYLAAAKQEQEDALVQRAKELATAANATEASLVIDAKLAKG